MNLGLQLVMRSARSPILLLFAGRGQVTAFLWRLAQYFTLATTGLYIVREALR